MVPKFIQSVGLGYILKNYLKAMNLKQPIQTFSLMLINYDPMALAMPGLWVRFPQGTSAKIYALTTVSPTEEERLLCAHVCSIVQLVGKHQKGTAPASSFM